MKVCVIEDDPLMLGHLEDMLKRMDYQVMTAETEETRSRHRAELVTRRRRGGHPDARSRRPQLHNGDPDLRDTMRVIVITGGGRLGPGPILKMASGLGAHATLTKPITEEALKRRAIKVRTAMR